MHLFPFQNARRLAYAAEASDIISMLYNVYGCTLLEILRARLAYFNVLRVSTKSQSDGEIQAIIVVQLKHWTTRDQRNGDQDVRRPHILCAIVVRRFGDFKKAVRRGVVAVW